VRTQLERRLAGARQSPRRSVRGEGVASLTQASVDSGSTPGRAFAGRYLTRRGRAERAGQARSSKPSTLARSDCGPRKGARAPAGFVQPAKRSRPSRSHSPAVAGSPLAPAARLPRRRDRVPHVLGRSAPRKRCAPALAIDTRPVATCTSGGLELTGLPEGERHQSQHSVRSFGSASARRSALWQRGRTSPRPVACGRGGP